LAGLSSWQFESALGLIKIAAQRNSNKRQVGTSVLCRSWLKKLLDTTFGGDSGLTAVPASDTLSPARGDPQNADLTLHDSITINYLTIFSRSSTTAGSFVTHWPHTIYEIIEIHQNTVTKMITLTGLPYKRLFLHQQTMLACITVSTEDSVITLSPADLLDYVIAETWPVLVEDHSYLLVTRFRP
jgi:hypothetical protein